MSHQKVPYSSLHVTFKNSLDQMSVRCAACAHKNWTLDRALEDLKSQYCSGIIFINFIVLFVCWYLTSERTSRITYEQPYNSKWIFNWMDHDITRIIRIFLGERLSFMHAQCTYILTNTKILYHFNLYYVRRMVWLSLLSNVSYEFVEFLS